VDTVGEVPQERTRRFCLSLAADTWYCDDVCAATNAELLFPEPNRVGRERQINFSVRRQTNLSEERAIHATRDVKRFAAECGWMEISEMCERDAKELLANRRPRRCVLGGADEAICAIHSRESLGYLLCVRFISARKKLTNALTRPALIIILIYVQPRLLE